LAKSKFSVGNAPIDHFKLMLEISNTHTKKMNMLQSPAILGAFPLFTIAFGVVTTEIDGGVNQST
jgi:hypothetical protein